MIWILLSNILMNRKNLVLIVIISFLPFLSPTQKMSFVLITAIECIRVVLYSDHNNNVRTFYKMLPVGNAFQFYNIFLFETVLVFFVLTIFFVSGNVFHMFDIETSLMMIFGIYIFGGILTLFSFVFSPDIALNALIMVSIVVYIAVSLYSPAEILLVRNVVENIFSNKYCLIFITTVIYLFQYLVLISVC